MKNLKIIAQNIIDYCRTLVEYFFTKLGLGMRAKLIIIFVIIKVIPLVLITLIAWRQFGTMGDDVAQRTQQLAAQTNTSLHGVGKIAVSDSVNALNDRATEDIERMTTDAAHKVADFLYDRDTDILFLAALDPSETNYRQFAEKRLGKLIKKGAWKLAPDGKSWITTEQPPEETPVVSSNKENDLRFNYRPPNTFRYDNLPLYLEITFVDLNGNELVKTVTSKRMDARRKNIANRANTYVKAETYFAELRKLKAGDIYVSDVIGAYVPSRLIGMYTPENAQKRGLKYQPEEEAYAGMENPNGKRFEGIIRWATPVTRGGRIIGYVTMALNHDHIMEFTDHIMPTGQRYTELPNAYEGNYAFIWDYKCRSICHPRHHSIVGFDQETGDPQIPWLEDSIYQAWQASGKNYVNFIKDQPTFVEQSVKKKPAKDLTDKGLVGLDGRYLNFAPQCTGWFDLTSEGGSGSFVILWSGLTKLTTAATIPYYTGQYGASKRGFGFVAIGAGLDDFHRPAKETEKKLEQVIANADKEVSHVSEQTQLAIKNNLLNTATQLVTSTGVIIVLVVFIAIWMASVFTNSITKLITGISRFRNGERQFRFNAPVKDELGALADSFDDMADSIVNSVNGPLCITDMDCNIIYMNESGLQHRGKTLEEVVGTPYSENSIYPAESKYYPIEALEEGREAEVYYVENSGRYMKGTANYFLDKDGKKTGYIIVTTDVTEMTVERMKIEEQRTLLDKIFSSSPDLMWYKDAKGRYLAVNPRFSALAGNSTDDVVGKTTEEVFPPEVAKKHIKSDAEAIAAAAPLYSEDRLLFADQHEEVLDTVRTPLYDANGVLVGLLGVARNVTVRVSMENELRKTQAELEKAVNDANRANEHKGEFLARMSHEIRTPMNAIIGMTSIVKRKLGEENPFDTAEMAEVKSHIKQIEASSQHLLGLLNDILDISKIEAGKIELSEEAVELPRLVNTVTNMIKPRCDEKNITFGVFLDTFSPSTFLCDSLRLRQVLINLLGNAVKFTPDYGRVEFHIEKNEQKDGKTLLEFSVRDTGIGISEEALPHIFQSFEQASGKISRQYGGTGLGLAISKRIVQLFGGDITVTSKEGEGSKFSFSIWLNEADPVTVANDDIYDATDKFTGKKALVVDDVFVNRMIVTTLLETTGMEFDEADDGLSALEKFKESPANAYDIIFMDLQMPNMDGYEAASAIRALERSDARSVPIIALTANVFKDDIEKALKHGMNAHIGKPIEMDHLTEILFRFLATK